MMLKTAILPPGVMSMFRQQGAALAKARTGQMAASELPPALQKMLRAETPISAVSKHIPLPKGLAPPKPAPAAPNPRAADQLSSNFGY
jgi:hypothetical protein